MTVLKLMLIVAQNICLEGNCQCILTFIFVNSVASEVRRNAFCPQRIFVSSRKQFKSANITYVFVKAIETFFLISFGMP